MTHQETFTEPGKDSYVASVQEAVLFIQEKIKEPNFKPHVAITLGSGLGKLSGLIEPVATIPYADIPHFPVATVPGHEGKMIIGLLEGVPVVGLKGRKHYYEVANEPNAMEKVTFPVQVAASLGCDLYVATNAAGGLNTNYKVGELMTIKSHLGLFIPNPLLGTHHDFGGNEFFQPQSGQYDSALRNTFKKIDPTIHEGVYAAVSGRTFESQAECLMLRKMGVDAVGMSTVPEIIVAANRGMKTFATSMITNVIAEDGTNATSHEEVMAVLNDKKTEEKLLHIFTEFFKTLTEAY